MYNWHLYRILQSVQHTDASNIYLQSGRAHGGGSPPSISNGTPCCPATVVDRAAVDVNHSRLLQEFNLWPAQLFDRHTSRHAVAANHIFQRFTWPQAQWTPWLNISYVNNVQSWQCISFGMNAAQPGVKNWNSFWKASDLVVPKRQRITT